MGEALQEFVSQAQHLAPTFDSQTVFAIGGWNISRWYC